MELIALSAFTDNYIWLWRQADQAVVVDPGDAKPVLAALSALNLQLGAILVTHHHADHTGGVDELCQATGAQVYTSNSEDWGLAHTRVSQGSHFELLGQRVEVIDVPGHTAGHVAYHLPQAQPAPVLFCGDTLFSGGCGRLFEGTPAQMLHSLSVLADLASNTRVCCAHEYTLSNLRFAAAVEPDNIDLQNYTAHCQQLRAQGQPTLPTPLGLELRINPFLRSRQAAIRHSVARHAGLSEQAQQDDVAVFAALRQWKNDFR